MRAVILAAGVGRRLRPHTEWLPKCLISFGGRTLLHRHIVNLSACGVTDISVVVGHLAEQVRAEVAHLKLREPVRLLYNPRYEAGSALSLLVGADVFREAPAVIMDADILYAPELLRRLLDSPSPNCLLADSRFVDTGEEVKVAVRGDGRVWEIGKALSAEGQLVGESVGIFRFDTAAGSRLAELLRVAAAADPELEYEPVLNDLAQEIHMHYLPVNGSPWIEIDTREDVERGRAIARAQSVQPAPDRGWLGRIQRARRIAQLDPHTQPVSDAPYRAVSIFPSLLAARAGLTANQITVLWIVIGLLGLIALGWADYWVRLAGACLLQCSYLLDFVDGEVARLQNRTSRFGAFLDLAGHGLIKCGLFLALGYRLFLCTGWQPYLLFAFVACVTVTNGYALPFYAVEASVRYEPLPVAAGRAGQWRLGILKALIFESPGLYAAVLAAAAVDRLGWVVLFYGLAGPLWFVYRARKFRCE